VLKEKIKQSFNGAEGKKRREQNENSCTLNSKNETKRIGISLWIEFDNETLESTGLFIGII
jgi:hypothetical protein